MREAVLIPALNEGPRIADCLIQVRRYFDGTVLVVDGGSTDNTCTMAKAHGAEVIQQEGQGYANALRSGYQALLARNVNAAVQLDADGQHPPAAIPQLLEALSGSDLVMASRAGTKSPSTWDRRLGNATLALLVRRVTGSPLRDVTSGYWALGESALNLLATHMPPTTADANVRVLALRQGLSIQEVPVYMPNRSGGVSMHDGMDGLRHFWDSIIAVGTELRRPRAGI